VPLEEITGGDIKIGDKVVNGLPPKDRDIAMVFQNYALYPHKTVAENMGFALKLRKTPKAEIDQRVKRAAEILDLMPYLNRYPRQLSGGQRQRVAMGRAIVRAPQVFLFDEPLSNLDAKLRVQMRAEIARLQNRLGTTTVYVTHDQTEAMTLGDRVVVLRAGEAQQIGTPDELYNSPANLFVAGFIGSPSMNFFPASPSGTGLRLPFGEVRLPAGTASAADVIVGVRPEHFEDAALLDAAERSRSLTFRVNADLVESLGADKYVYFSLAGAGAQSSHLAELAADTGVGHNRYVARVSAESAAATGHQVDLALNTGRLIAFDAQTGANLSA
jgi:multiple sugar transport system ATP-binding protein